MTELILREKVLQGIRECTHHNTRRVNLCKHCPYKNVPIDGPDDCIDMLLLDAKKLIEGEITND